MKPSPRFDSGARLTLAFALFVIGVNLVNVVLPMALPGDGWAYSELAWRPGQPVWVATRALSSRASPLEAGDRLVEVDGQPVSSRQAGVFALSTGRLPTWVEGGQAQYRVVRDGQTLWLEVPLRRLSFVEALGYLRPGPAESLHGLVLPVTLVIAFIVFWLRPQLTAARVMLVFGAALATSFSEAPIMTSGLMYPGVLVLPLLLSPWQFALLPSLLHLLLVFPVVKRPLREWPRPTLAMLYLSAQVLIWLGWLLNWGQPAATVGFYYAVVGGQAVLLLVLMIVSLAHTWLTVRAPVARAQTGWMTFGLMVGFMGSSTLWLIATFLFSFSPVWQAVSAVLMLSLPAGLAMAILRYRLFDIDVIVNRALVYGTLTALLALAYFGVVVVLQGVLRFFTGAAQGQLVTVVSTLAIAALFTPLRARLQRLIDRRFYRHKYDAGRTLASFGHTLRDDVDLGQLSERLKIVVEETMQPEHVSLWLRRSSERQ